MHSNAVRSAAPLRDEALILVDEITHRVYNEYAQIVAAMRIAARTTKSDETRLALPAAADLFMMARRPDLVRKAILVDTGPADGEGIDGIWDVLQDAFAFAEREKRHPKRRLFFTNSSQSQKADLAFLDRLSQPFAQPGRPIENGAVESQVIAWGRSNDQYTAKILATTLIVSGDRDDMIPLSKAIALAGQIPHAQLAVYPDARHGALFQYKELFVDQAKTFLNA